MPRLMSVAYTADQVEDRIKSVTRRKGWWRAKNGSRLLLPGDQLTLCRKVMGRKPGEPLVRLTNVEVVDVSREVLDVINNDSEYATAEVALEGFPGMPPTEFVQRFFIDAQGMSRWDLVTRIEWRYLDQETS